MAYFICSLGQGTISLNSKKNIVYDYWSFHMEFVVGIFKFKSPLGLLLLAGVSDMTFSIRFFSSFFFNNLQLSRLLELNFFGEIRKTITLLALHFKSSTLKKKLVNLFFHLISVDLHIEILFKF